MTGWNLPPGCSVNDLPGNSKSEKKAEALYDLIWDQFPASLSEAQCTTLADWIYSQIGEAYSNGYQQAMADSALAKDLNDG